jgi:transposase InsO family protein
MHPAYIQQLVSIADAVAAAGHGEKETIYQRACEQLSKSRSTLLAHLKKVAVSKPRKRRADAGVVALSIDDARIISAYCMEGYRKNNRKITALKEAIQVLRDNGEIVAATLDDKTGELVPLSESAIANGLRTYNLHPDQLRQATPHTNLQSLHPNHVWQVDGSVCVIYYLPDGSSELVELDDAVHYKNKPQNLKAIEQFRVIRYVVSDHASGVVRYRYYPHSESGEHTVRFLAWAMAPKTGNDPFHGAPFIVMVDPGATSGGLVRRFCSRMGIELIVNRRRNPRAKGSVEKGNHLVETSFEQALRFMKKRPANFDELNALAETYQLWWNATKEHSRTKRTRFAVWLTITAEQLRITPSAEVLLSLATDEPIKRQVRGDLTVSFKNRTWKVDHVPGVYVKSDVYVHWHPFMVDTAMAVVWSEDGQEQHIALYEDKTNALGFRESAAVIGQSHTAKPDTVADTNRKHVHQLAAGTDTLAATEKKRDNKHYVPFDGRIDPLLASKQELPTFMPKRGTELDVKAPTVELLKLSPVQAAKWLLGRLGDDYRAELLADVQARWPEGPTGEDLELVLADLAAGRNAAGRAKLQAV